MSNVHVTYALSLLFLGLNHTRFKSMMNELDRLFYGRIANMASGIKKMENKMN